MQVQVIFAAGSGREPASGALVPGHIADGRIRLVALLRRG
jgi:hypothetical protein